MKKLGKFIFGTISLAALAGGAFYFLKNLADKRAAEDFEDFEDDFEDFEDELSDDEKKDNHDSDSREYVSIDISSGTSELAEDNTTSESDLEEDNDTTQGED